MAKKRKVRYGLNDASDVISMCFLTKFVKAVEVNTRIMSLSQMPYEHIENSRSQQRGDVHVGANPRKHDVCSTVTVMIRLLRGSVTMLFLSGWLVVQRSASSLPNFVDIFTRGWNLDFHDFLAVRVLGFLGTA